jgi:glycogen operon protein
MRHTDLRLWPGRPLPLGASWDGRGVDFALFSARATKVELCLFGHDGREEHRIALPEMTHEIWHGYLPDLRPGQLYGYRVHGPYEPDAGNRFNPNKLLIDPYARMLKGEIQWNDALYGYQLGHPDQDLAFDDRDSAPFIPKCVVVDPAFTWGPERPPHRPPHQSIIYEMHPRGFTMGHPDLPETIRGTFSALARPPIIDYLRELGVTAVELMPIHAFVHDRHLVERGLRNYWGYNSISFFAPHAEYLGNAGLGEFKTFVQLMHDAGIEVILDVVYNHTAEGNHLGPTLSFKGIDNENYYHLMPDRRRYYNDFTGTGNSLELRHPYVLRMVTDSLRYWAQEMKVDGFRFDLATTLARPEGMFDEEAGFLVALAQDPVLSAVKLIAEPWDIGLGGYRVGAFPPGWMEWNGKYRDTVRKFWKGDEGQLPDFTSRISGSADIYNHRGRRPWASINFVTAHDGFTLRDLVSYNSKHNEANLEDNRDGTNDNNSWNCGVEGDTDDPGIRRLRMQQMRNFLSTLLLRQGTPMLLMGDEVGRSQGGNNNAYCQDNAIGWFNWSAVGGEGQDLLEFTKMLIRLRHEHIVFRRSRFFSGSIIPGTDVKDVTWLRPDGQEMGVADWQNPIAKAIVLLLSGEAGLTHLTEEGEPEPDDTFVMIFNASHVNVEVTLPERAAEGRWYVEINTAAEDGLGHATCDVGTPFDAVARSFVLLRGAIPAT